MMQMKIENADGFKSMADRLASIMEEEVDQLTKEVEGDYLTVRNNKTGEQFEIKPDELQENLLKEIAEKAI